MKDTTIKQEKDGKLGIIALFLSVLVVAFYFFSSHNEEKSVVTFNESGTTSTTETDSLKRLEIYGNSGANWGMSPFGSGKPLKEEEEQLRFKKPNLEWKTRTINGLTYVFGEGNPKEVEPKIDMTKKYEIAELSYVNQETEKNLLLFLSNPTLENVINKCGYLVKPDTSSNSILLNNLPNSINQTDFSIDKTLYIDQKTGQKMIDNDRLSALEYIISSIQSNQAVNNCLSMNEQSDLSLLSTQVSNLDASNQMQVAFPKSIDQ